MKKQFNTMCTLLAGIAIFLSGCATTEVMPTFQAENLDTMAASGAYIQKADTFYLMYDNSASMTDFDGQNTKANVAKAVVTRFNATVPTSIKLKGALQIFGPLQADGTDHKKVYGISDYVRYDLGQAISKNIGIPGGSTPIGSAIHNSQLDLEGETSRIAAILISDGNETTNTAVAAAEQMKAKFGDRLCLYTIRVGESEAGKKLMREVAGASGCGFAVAADHVLTGQGMASFVQRVFFDVTSDSDGDGVMNNADMCPSTPIGIAVDSKGCFRDSDNDGIGDYYDRCPNTPANSWVNAAGCPAQMKAVPGDRDRDGIVDSHDRCPNTPLGAKVAADGCWVIDNILFDHNKHFIRGSEYGKLEEMFVVLQANSDLTMRIDGHTDNTATPEYNMPLSKKRAEAVLNYFVKMGVDAKRLSIDFFGLTRPTESNDTKEGRAKNRRAEMHPSR